MRKSLKLLLSAGVLALGAGAVLTASSAPADARTSLFLGIGLPPLYLGPPAYYYPPPPPAYYYPPPVYAPAPPPCDARYDWRWDGYQWRQVYVSCYEASHQSLVRERPVSSRPAASLFERLSGS